MNYENQFLIIRITLRNQQIQSRKCIVIDFEFTTRFEPVFILFQEPDKKKSSYPFVPITK